MSLILITGPVRSGKSRLAVNLAEASGLAVSYIATAARDPHDSQWVARLDRHLRERPAGWSTVETANMDALALRNLIEGAEPERCLLIDAAGTWLANRIGARAARLESEYAAVEAELDREASELTQAMVASRALVIVVCEQVGWDVVPVAASGRIFRDVLGRMSQALAAQAERAYLVVAGYAIDLHAVGVRV